MSKKAYIIGGIAAVVVAGAAYASFGHKTTTTDAKTVTVGRMADSKQEDAIWKVVSKTAKDKYGITLKYKLFTDYSQPNKALADGDIDLNAFQNYPFLENWNKANKTDIVSIGDTFVSPMRVFSNKVKSLDDLKDGATITLPNDATNESRALKVLQSAGIIKLKSGDTLTVKDVTSNPKNLKLKEVDASQTIQALDSVDAAVANVNYATAAGLDLSKAIYVEPATGADIKPYYNFIAANAKDKNKTLYKDVVKSYQTQAVKDEIKKQYGVAEVAVFDVK